MIKSGKAPYVPPEDLELTVGKLKGPNMRRNRVVLYFSHYLGLRAKELAALKLSDVYDHKRSKTKETIRLLAAYTKGQKFREVYLVNEQAIDHLKAYLYAERCDSSPEAPLFMSQKGGHFNNKSMARMINTLYKQAGVNASSHSGRRSFATHLIRKNVDIHSVQQLMGHSSIQTTQEYFATDPNKLRDAMGKL